MPATLLAFKPAAPTPELASARLRCYKPLAYLNAAGQPCELFDDRRMDRYRAVVFQKAYTDADLALVRHLRGLGCRTVFDLCDNHFHAPADRPDLAERAERLRRMIDAVDAVTVATPELGKLVGRPATTIDDALDDVPPTRWERARAWLPRRGSLRSIWYGNAGTDDPPFGMIDLARIRPALEAAHARAPLTLTVVSNSRAAFERHLGGAAFPKTYREWDTARFPGIFRRHDVCLIPVSANPFTACKTVNRLALSLLLGVPAIADAIPSYEELRPFALFGDWTESVGRYAGDASLRRRHVRAGQAYLRSKYNPRRVVEQWSNVLNVGGAA